MKPDPDLCASRDIRGTRLYGEVLEFYTALHSPGTGSITDAADVDASPDGKFAAFTGSTYGDMASTPVTRICLLRLDDAALSVLPTPAGNDRHARWSPDGSQLAFLTDRAEPGRFQLAVVNGDGGGEVRAAPRVDGTIEYLHWSPDGKRILVGVAGSGADLAGCEGGHKTRARSEDLPDWAPFLDTGDGVDLWRKLFVFEVADGRLRAVSPDGINFWEATWLGDAHIATVTSESHSEGSWYRSRLQALSVDDASIFTLYEPDDQIGVPAASKSGSRLAFIEAICSDRLIVAGRLQLLDPTSGTRRTVETHGVDVTHLDWRGDQQLVYAGIRGFDTVVGEIDWSSGAATEQWSSRERTLGSWNPTCVARPGGGFIAVSEAYDVPPEIVTIQDGSLRTVRSFASPTVRSRSFSTARIEPFTWKARDQLVIQGWVVRPPGEGPLPLVMDIHGGPIWCCRNRWQGRLRGAKILADHGIASFYPNPRGSSGRGAEFARLVKGDMGGEDTHDYLTGVDALVAAGIADAARLGVTGISYGGFMSAWLITQDARFAAAAPISCVSDWYSQHRTSQIPFFDRLFLDGDPAESGGRFFDRSPVMFASRVRTPTIQLTGALDQNTPPTQALEFHRSLLENGVRSVLATYPTAGHGIRTFPEVMDATARYVGWMLEHLIDGRPRFPA